MQIKQRGSSNERFIMLTPADDYIMSRMHCLFTLYIGTTVDCQILNNN